MKEGKSSTAAEIERSLTLKQQADRLKQQNQLLRASLRTVRQQLREERAKARRVSRVLNPHLVQSKRGFSSHQRENHEVGLLFLKSELQLSQTFLAIALNANDGAKRRRNIENARAAYNALNRFYRKALMTKAEAKVFERGIAKVKAALQQIGETI